MIVNTGARYATVNELIIVALIVLFLAIAVAYLIAAMLAEGLAEKRGVNAEFNRLAARLAQVEKRQEGFAALEELGIMAQLGQEMLAKTEADLRAMEQEVATLTAAAQARHDQTLAHLNDQIMKFRTELAGAGKGRN